MKNISSEIDCKTGILPVSLLMKACIPSEQLFPHLGYIAVAASFHLWFPYENRTVSNAKPYGFDIKNVKVCLLKKRYDLCFAQYEIVLFC